MGLPPSAPTTELALHFDADELRVGDCLARLQAALGQFDLNDEQRQALKLILAELFSNALEHGVLGLDSRIKRTPEGFAQYLQLRDERLKALQAGHVECRLMLDDKVPPMHLCLQIKDSGPGFDFAGWQADHETATERLHGRGLLLVRWLAADLHFEERGSLAVVDYSLAPSSAPETADRPPSGRNR